MPLWDLVPAVLDGDSISADDGNMITDDNGDVITWSAGWRLVLAEVDAPLAG